MYLSLLEEAMIKEAAAEELLEEAELLKISAEELPWVLRHPFLTFISIPAAISGVESVYRLYRAHQVLKGPFKDIRFFRRILPALKSELIRAGTRTLAYGLPPAVLTYLAVKKFRQNQI